LKRFTTDEALDAQSTPEAIPALAPSTHGLQLDLASEELPEHLASEELPEHLARLCGVVAEERGHIVGWDEAAAFSVAIWTRKGHERRG
jgi:hypothetical protein